jgi:putative ABC transport system permease protein
MVLVLVVTMVWAVLQFVDDRTREQSRDVKGIITERWQIPSQMPMEYKDSLCEGGYSREGDYRIDAKKDSMYWSFYGGNIEPDVKKQTRDTLVFFFCMNPSQFVSMMDGIDELTSDEVVQVERWCAEMMKDRRNVLIGRERLKSMKKQVGDTITVYGVNYKDVNLECKILGTFPDGRYNQSAVMNYEYLDQALEAYKKDHTGAAHPMASKTLNLVWIRLPDSKIFDKVTKQISENPRYTTPAVKCETASSGIAGFLDSYRDLLWIMRWLLAPTLLATMALVIANAISISVRERRTEMAVLKVLGFSPGQVMALVLGEALLIGILSGVLSAGLTIFAVNSGGGVKFPIAFFPAFKIPYDAFWWGAAVGGGTALVGSLLPAWSARTVKVSEVFSKVS